MVVETSTDKKSIMFSTEELISTYEKYSDEELFAVLSNIDSYSEEAKKSLNIVIANKGGMQNLQERMQENKLIDDEVYRIISEVTSLKNKNAEIYQIRQSVNSNILSKEKVNEIIEDTFSHLELEQEDRKIKPSTIGGSLFGGIVASIVGGILWGLQMIYTGRIFFILIFGLALLCYGIIRLFTKQSNKNIVVSIATIISTLIALFLGQLLYHLIGYRG
ncbi:MAG: hypothetical protein ABI861_05200 [Panacibacter sp.]